MTSILMISNMLSILMIFMTTPIMLSTSILLFSLFLALLFSIFISSFYSYILFIIYIGGMLIIFAYFTSISQYNSTQNKNHLGANKKMYFLTLFLIFSNMQMISPNLSKSNSHIEIYSLMTFDNLKLMLILTMFLFFILMIIEKMTSPIKSPLRPF